MSTVHRQEVVKRAYWKGNYSYDMAGIFSCIDWEKEFEGADVEICWSSFKDKIGDAVDKFQSPEIEKKTSFMRKETIKLINKREKQFVFTVEQIG